MVHSNSRSEFKDSKIVVVDDEQHMVDFLKQALVRKGYDTVAFTDGNAALEYLDKNETDLLLTDYKMPKMLGIELIEEVKSAFPKVGVIMMTAYGTIESAVKALKLGAADYITKPFSIEDIYESIEEYFKSMVRKETNVSVRGEDRFGELIGKSQAMQKIYKTIALIADSKASVFVHGPSGTGKELVARAIHYNSNRKNKPFIRVNCAALPEHLMESELFGHEKGAFTGAIRKNLGKFELADSGTLLLDEITEMNVGLQAKLLRAIQEKEFTRVGGSETIKVDVRIIATSNRDLNEAMADGQLREDLYYRLNTIPISLPSLAERKEDIVPLMNHFVELFSQEYEKEIHGVTDNALARLMRESFPGNVRELENRILRAVILCQSEMLTEEYLFIEDTAQDNLDNGNLLNLQTPMSIEDMERDLILQTLEYHDYNRTQSAESLGINVRTLRNKLNQYKEQGFISDTFFSD